MNGTEKNDIRKQIKEDIDEYKIIYSNQENIQKDEWAFNWWILDKFFMIDEDVIPDNITDYNDKSIDSYVWHEELKNLYLIQNKYYDDNTNVTSGYVNNDFLTRSIGSLEKDHIRETENYKKYLQSLRMILISMSTCIYM